MDSHRFVSLFYQKDHAVNWRKDNTQNKNFQTLVVPLDAYNGQYKCDN